MKETRVFFCLAQKSSNFELRISRSKFSTIHILLFFLFKTEQEGVILHQETFLVFRRSSFFSFSFSFIFFTSCPRWAPAVVDLFLYLWKKNMLEQISDRTDYRKKNRNVFVSWFLEGICGFVKTRWKHYFRAFLVLKGFKKIFDKIVLTFAGKVTN